jgi:hypothetical protein
MGGIEMNSTPRTNEQINGKPCTRFEILAGDSLRNAAVPLEFARTIERELNAANAEIERLTNKVAQLYEGAEEAKQRIKRLEEAGDVLCENSNPSRWDSPADAARKLTEQSNWIKAKEAKP